MNRKWITNNTGMHIGKSVCYWINFVNNMKLLTPSSYLIWRISDLKGIMKSRASSVQNPKNTALEWTPLRNSYTDRNAAKSWKSHILLIIQLSKSGYRIHANKLDLQTRMHSSRMCTASFSDRLSCHVPPPMHAPLPPLTVHTPWNAQPPATHVPCHPCPPCHACPHGQ